jgi:phage shock protein B
MGFGTFLGVALILFLLVVVPLFAILYFITKWRQGREMSQEDERLLEELWELSQRLEDRLETLERILEDDLPRTRSHRGSTYMEH